MIPPFPLHNFPPSLCILMSHEPQVAAYDTVAKKMAFFEPGRAKDFLFISGTKVRAELCMNEQNRMSLWYALPELLELLVHMCFVLDAEFCEDGREPSGRFHVPKWMEGVGKLLPELAGGRCAAAATSIVSLGGGYSLRSQENDG